MTPQEVDDIAGDDLYARHLFFIRFVLGEPLKDTIWMAHPAAKAEWPLSVETMEHVAAHWNDATPQGDADE